LSAGYTLGDVAPKLVAALHAAAVLGRIERLVVGPFTADSAVTGFVQTIVSVVVAMDVGIVRSEVRFLQTVVGFGHRINRCVVRIYYSRVLLFGRVFGKN